jgi:cell division protein FtsZ
MEAAHEEAEIIFGTVIDESLGERIKVTVVATGLGQERNVQKTDAPVVAAKVAQTATAKTAIPVAAKGTVNGQPATKKPAATTPAAKNPPPPNGATASESGILARARGIGEKLGITDFTDNPLNIPSYIKRPPGRDV